MIHAGAVHAARDLRAIAANGASGVQNNAVIASTTTSSTNSGFGFSDSQTEAIASVDGDSAQAFFGQNLNPLLNSGNTLRATAKTVSEWLPLICMPTTVLDRCVRQRVRW